MASGGLRGLRRLVYRNSAPSCSIVESFKDSLVVTLVSRTGHAVGHYH